jgi:hypothetical protein
VYGFGQLIDNSDEIASALKRLEQSRSANNEDTFVSLDEFNTFGDND